MQNKRFSSQRVIVFKRWQSKSYASFNSLKKIIKIGTLCVAYSLIKNPIISQAQTDTIDLTKSLEIEEVIISAEWAEASLSEIGRVVQVITKSEIEGAAIQSIQDLLEYALNTDVRQRGVHGVQGDISIRGGSFDQLLILLNGINITDPQTGHHNLSLPISIESIERIEILEGPGARIFGPNAFSGAINIITASKKNNHYSTNVSVGQYGYYHANTNLTLKSKHLTNYLSVGNKSSDGYMSNTDFRNRDLFYHGKLKIQSKQIDCQLGYSDKSFGANSFYTAKYPNQFEQLNTYFGSIKLKTSGKYNFEPSIYWRRNQDRFELFREDYYQKNDQNLYIYQQDTAGFRLKDGSLYPYSGHNYHLTNVYGANIRANLSWKAGRTSVGINTRQENILSNVLGNTMDSTRSVPGESDGVFTKTYTRNHINCFLEHSVDLGRFHLSGGFLLYWYSDTVENNIGISPGIDMNYRISNSLRWFASYNQAVRMPTFTDMFYVGPTNIGNPAILHEKGSTIESGLKWIAPFITSHIAGFYRESENVIDWVKDHPDSLWESKNITEINTLGMEFSSKINLQEIFSDKFFIKTIGIQYAFLDQSKTSEDYISKYALEYLKHKFSFSINHTIYKGLQASWRITYQDRAGQYLDFYTNQQVQYQSFTNVDGKIYLKDKWYMIFVEATNIFDISYFDYGNIPQPGRWIRGGIRIDLDIVNP